MTTSKQDRLALAAEKPVTAAVIKNREFARGKRIDEELKLKETSPDQEYSPTNS